MVSHRLANKSLSRPTAHRVLMLRNMVSSLLEHESISTTVAKAKEAQKVAEKVITWGKNGRKQDWDRANMWLLNSQKTLRPLFTTLAERYALRQGGYTRLTLAGHRVGDRAPLAILSLVDSPKDLKYDITARTVGRELALRARARQEDGDGEGARETWWEFRKAVVEGEGDGLDRLMNHHWLDVKTRKNVGKVLAFRPVEITASEEQEEVIKGEEEPPTKDEEATSAAEAAEPERVSVQESNTPVSAFLALSRTHYLATLATLSKSTPTAPSTSSVLKQLTTRLNPSDSKGAPRPVLTVPVDGRRARAGERTQGWEGWAKTDVGRMGPIGLAKGASSRESRRRGAPELD
ncbi:ribosomal protein L17 [Meredithblackwellia eburnea MCA 4105]